MMNTKWFGLCALMVPLLTAPGFAQRAQTPDPDGESRTQQEEAKARRATLKERWMQRFDRNQDGRVDEKERSQARAQRGKRMRAQNHAPRAHQRTRGVRRAGAEGRDGRRFESTGPQSRRAQMARKFRAPSRAEGRAHRRAERRGLGHVRKQAQEYSKSQERTEVGRRRAAADRAGRRWKRVQRLRAERRRGLNQEDRPMLRRRGQARIRTGERAGARAGDPRRETLRRTESRRLPRLRERVIRQEWQDV